jgi:hypothetical protein
MTLATVTIATKNRFSLLRLCGAGLLAASFAAAAWLGLAPKTPASPGLIVHEWGTFTSIAGNDGHAVEWTPLSPASDLPAFVEHTNMANLKGGLRGTVRMETPVIYFYSPREATVSVKVAFTKGLITEWYPHADRVAPVNQLKNVSLSQLPAAGTIAWDSVTLAPNLAANFPRANAASHYYAARETSASPLRVSAASGSQQEKFLFYRGVASVALPLSAKILTGGEVELRNLGPDPETAPVPAFILFDRRGSKLSYHVYNALTGRAVLDLPTAPGSFDALRAELESLLVAQGLFRDEAHAMVETWRDSWFEEGSRLFYIVPRSFVDSVLPLSINPAPTQLVRVFVGRLELVTPATRESVAAALASNDKATLAKYGRFLEPILAVLHAKDSAPAKVSSLR